AEKTSARIVTAVQCFPNMLNRRLPRHRSKPMPNRFCAFWRTRSIQPGWIGTPSAPTVSSLFFFVSLTTALAAPLVPIQPGMTWRYSMTEEVGKGLKISNSKQDVYGKVRLPVIYRLDKAQDVDGRELLRFEMHRAGSITNTDLVTVDEHGIICWARINL